jgi:hypothetical protein
MGSRVQLAPPHLEDQLQLRERGVDDLLGDERQHHVQAVLHQPEVARRGTSLRGFRFVVGAKVQPLVVRWKAGL